ncbi:phosphoglycerate mutase-like protein [Ceratobasidium sp. AG-I]|nr:phosphoglycerate mutase-like protein [Ceratobasidium sp. AG-I]
MLGSFKIFGLILVLFIASSPSTSAMSEFEGTDEKTFSYEVVPGYFVQSDPNTDAAVVGPNPPAFGLEATGSATYWSDFKSSIANLQNNAPEGVRYAVCWLGRHGQGWHNVGESLYGTGDWDNHWSKLNGDGNITWGPDAELTELGQQQAQLAHNVWATELAKADPVPLPTKLFSSPMSRAASTLEITFDDILLPASGKKDSVYPYVMENLREMMGEHTCDMRRTRSYIQKTYPDFFIEHGFTEQDELWKADHRETDAEIDARLKLAWDVIFGRLLGSDDTFFSITAHSGAINASLRVLGHRAYSLPTGGVIPIVIRAVQN